MRRRLPQGELERCLLAALLLAVCACAGAQPAGPMVFALGYGTAGPDMNNFVAIGTYAFDGQEVVAEFAEFDAKANRKPHQAPVRHEMRAPYGGGACTNKLIDLPSESARRSVRGSWNEDGGRLRLTYSARSYEWTVEAGAEGAYRLAGITDGTSELPLTVGFAYASPAAAPARLAMESFLPWYEGEIYHKDNHSAAETPWKLMPSGLRVSAFTVRAGGNVLSLANPGQAPGIWVQNSILLNHDAFIHQDYGHDFNRNGCFDEYGHNKVLLAAGEQGGQPLRRMVYVEYSYARDGFPILSVGRYRAGR